MIMFLSYKQDKMKDCNTLSFALSRMRVNEASTTRFCPFSIEEADTVVNDAVLNRCKWRIPLCPIFNISGIFV